MRSDVMADRIVPQLIAPARDADGDQHPIELTWHNFLKLQESQSVSEDDHDTVPADLSD